MSDLTGAERRFLRGQAHGLKPLVHIGKQGLTDATVAMLDEALSHHELIKVRFVDFKEEKKQIAAEIGEKNQAELITMVGHTAIFFRRQQDLEKRKIRFPRRAE